MLNHNPSCTVASPMQCNYATERALNETSHATTMQPQSLKDLAMRILERNKYNSLCNSYATDKLHSSQIHATQNQNYATQKIDIVLQHYGLTMNDINQVAGEDFEDIKNNPEAIKSIAILITDTNLRQHGMIPASYTVKAHCDGCGDVYLPSSLASDHILAGCPWCFNRVNGIHIPRPMRSSK